MLRPERKNVLHALFAILLLMGFLISMGCDLTLGGDPIDGSDDSDDNNCSSVEVKRVSITSNGNQANNDSFEAALSSDGRFVAFESLATNLVLGDNNDRSDIFVHDRDTDEDGIFDEAGNISTARVSVASDGTQADNHSFLAAISSDGRFVAFESEANNLAANDSNNRIDIFVHDRDTDEDGIFDEPLAISTERVSIASNGTQANDNSFAAAISSDGRFVAFESEATNLAANDSNNRIDIFTRDRDAGITRRISLAFNCSEGDDSSFSAVISADEQFVAFVSLAENLVNSDTNGSSDIFVTPNPLSP